MTSMYTGTPTTYHHRVEVDEIGSFTKFGPRSVYIYVNIYMMLIAL